MDEVQVLVSVLMPVLTIEILSLVRWLVVRLACLPFLLHSDHSSISYELECHRSDFT